MKIVGLLRVNPSVQARKQKLTGRGNSKNEGGGGGGGGRGTNDLSKLDSKAKHPAGKVVPAQWVLGGRCRLVSSFGVAERGALSVKCDRKSCY